MKLTYAEVSSVGPVRPHNEDFVRFWEAEDEREIRARGAVALLADGVGGHGAGEVASQLAVETALRTFHEANPTATDNQLLWRMFNAANVAVYDEGMKRGGADRMATTLTISLFRRNEVAVGHVGDSRAYLVRQGQVKQLTSDHTYVAMQLKMNVISQDEAMTSELRGMLTRSIGQNPTVQVDYARSVLYAHDVIIQCSDGLHGCITEGELRDYTARLPPAEACEQLVRLAEKRGSEDNISVQIVRVESVPRVGYYRGSVAYFAPVPTPATNELQAGQVLDERFEIRDLISRSGMSSVFKATDLKTGRPVALKVPLASLEGDPAFFSRFEREEEIGRSLDHPEHPEDSRDRREGQEPAVPRHGVPRGADARPDDPDREAGAGGRDASHREPHLRRALVPPRQRESCIAISSRRTSCSAATDRCASWTSASRRPPRPSASRSAGFRRRSARPTTWRPSR